ncbi:MAG TPA: aminoacetone oxidase family FAD-binding enzyme [Candidatus Omnitrophota bacterium]|nr:aminoacetone oxidase family FAD-binding enzyme [Candidatus Omnitrophota bacterium]HRZ14549.1 aminoacetone oxidase family FAD-binding enzyme [Candidatus Omnitrophota bacterium]
MTTTVDTVVIGGGASGVVAAISAARTGKKVMICEQLPAIGKKILATGGGKCNLLNEHLDPACYNPAAQRLVAAVFARFGKEQIKQFFSQLGLFCYTDSDARVFPVTNQAATVVKVLELELKRLGVAISCDSPVTGLRAGTRGFRVELAGDRAVACTAVVIAGGGKTYPALGGKGTCYRLAQAFGHTVVEPVAVAVPLIVKDRICHLLQGQKIAAAVTSLIAGQRIARVTGDLLFTAYGLSGTAVLDSSRDIALALHRAPPRDAAVLVDWVPFMDSRQLLSVLKKRYSLAGRNGKADLLTGILPQKCSFLCQDVNAPADLDRLAARLKETKFTVSATRGWNEADFTAGGVAVPEVSEATLESKLQKGLYFCGEVLDVDGKRGGYNLAWAWASGYCAGSGN